jgi:hypothetical protein
VNYSIGTIYSPHSICCLTHLINFSHETAGMANKMDYCYLSFHQQTFETVLWHYRISFSQTISSTDTPAQVSCGPRTIPRQYECTLSTSAAGSLLDTRLRFNQAYWYHQSYFSL